MTPSLKAGAPAAPHRIAPRFFKEPWISDQVLKAKGKSFAHFAKDFIPRLERPQLISSVHGQIDRVLFTLPHWVFLEEFEEEPLWWPATYATAEAFRTLLKRLPPKTRFLVLIEDEVKFGEPKIVIDSKARLSKWLDTLNLNNRTEIVVAPSSVQFTIWAEDAYAVSRDTIDGEHYFVEPASFLRKDDAQIADIVAARTDMDHTQEALYFQGGNILIGDDFWFIGMDYPNRSLELQFVTPKPGESPRQSVTKAYGAALDHTRRLLTIGSRLDVPGYEDPKTGNYELIHEFTLDGEIWTETLYRGNRPGTVQPLFHIDMFITLAGRDSSGRYVVAIGDPRRAAEVLNEPVQFHATVEVFDDIAEQLDMLGFHVVRTPMPLTYDDDLDKRQRIWYFATSNNALVQVTEKSRDIWLPTYGHRKWPELAATDAENRRIWEQELHFTVHDLGDFHPFASNLGAAHCVKKYLARS